MTVGATAVGGRSLFVVATVLVLSAGAGCGGERIVASGDTDTFELTTSQLFVTLANRSGSALLDVELEVAPVGGSTVFTLFHPRLEPGEKRNFSIGDFRGKDGTNLNLRVHRPKSVSVSAHSQTGGEFSMQVPWE